MNIFKINLNNLPNNINREHYKKQLHAQYNTNKFRRGSKYKLFFNVICLFYTVQVHINCSVSKQPFVISSTFSNSNTRNKLVSSFLPFDSLFIFASSFTKSSFILVVILWRGSMQKKKLLTYIVCGIEVYLI